VDETKKKNGNKKKTRKGQLKVEWLGLWTLRWATNLHKA